MTTPKTVVIARLQTSNFDFVAVGATKVEAHQGLLDVTLKHSKAYNMSRADWTAMWQAYADCLAYHEMPLGSGIADYDFGNA
jgi:hypothetical protein